MGEVVKTWEWRQCQGKHGWIEKRRPPKPPGNNFWDWVETCLNSEIPLDFSSTSAMEILPTSPTLLPPPPTPFFFKNSVSEMSFLLGVILPKKFNILHVFSPLEGVAHSLHKEQNFRCFSQICWDGAESQPQSSHHWWCPCLRRPGRTVILLSPSSYCSLHDRTINQEMRCLDKE